MDNALLNKLRIKPQNRVLLINEPANSDEIFEDVPQDIQWNIGEAQEFDVLLLFATTKQSMNDALAIYSDKIKAPVVSWIIYPKTKSKLAGDLNIMNSWDDLAQYQLVPCASAAIDIDWTAIRIKPIGTVKKSGMANQDIVQGQLSQYIDVATKTVKLPDDVLKELQKEPQVWSFYKKLAYSHQKEYILWIVTAKQEKTRVDRISKMIEKLKAHKKNPSEK